MNPTILSWLAEERIRDLHHAADQWRLAASARPRTSRSAHRSAWTPSAWRRLTWLHHGRSGMVTPTYCTSC